MLRDFHKYGSILLSPVISYTFVFMYLLTVKSRGSHLNCFEIINSDLERRKTYAKCRWACAFYAIN